MAATRMRTHMGTEVDITQTAPAVLAAILKEGVTRWLECKVQKAEQWCSTCAAYAAVSVRALGFECPGKALGRRQRTLQRLVAGLHPTPEPLCSGRFVFFPR